MIINKSTNLAYWVGVVQSDGYFKKQYNKKRGIYRYYISLTVGKCSAEMLQKFRELSRLLWSIKGSTWEDKKRNSINYHFGCKNLIHLFKYLCIDFSDPPEPPQWILDKNELFGAYLAGILDGDGNVNTKRPKYPQCMIRIYSSKEQLTLMEAIKKILNCCACQYFEYNESYIGDRLIKGKASVLQFYVSSKNSKFFTDYIVSHMAISKKRDVIKNYILNKNGVAAARFGTFP